MQNSFKLNFFPFALIALLGSVAVTGGGIYLVSPFSDSTSDLESASWSNPSYVGGPINLTPGFKDWELCDLGGRIETLPPIFSMPKWGPAALTGATGCSTCGSGVTFAGSPRTAGLGLALAPPNDLLSDPGQLPPAPHDHSYVMADTGEVVYTEVDFVIPGQGFDFVWYRTYRSAYEFEGWHGYGWSHGAELYLVEGGNGNVGTSLGNGRTGDVYTKNGNLYTSPDGFWDKLTSPGTRLSGKYVGNKYFTKTEKNGVVWEFDDSGLGGNKKLFVCTSITDTWGNVFTLEYDALDSMRLIKVTDTIGHEATFTYSVNPTSGQKDLITQVTVSDTEVDPAYGDLTIDYTYNTDGTLERVDKMKTRLVEGGTVVRPYSKYEYLTSGGFDNNLKKVFYSNTTTAFFEFEYTMYDGVSDRCTKVIEADGGVHVYDFDEPLGTDFLTKYLDPANQRRDFVYPSLSDRTIVQVREHLEDKDGDPISGTSDLLISRGCDCGQITKLEYTDGSAEEWEYDPIHGSMTKYTRVPSTGSSVNTNLVKKWTYVSSTLPEFTRLATSSGSLSVDPNPNPRVTFDWDSNGGLKSVAWPTVAAGGTPNQSISFTYLIGSDGVLDWIKDPEGNETEYVFQYVGGNLKKTTSKGKGSGNEQITTSTIDELGHLIQRTGHLSGSIWNYSVSPRGDVLLSTGPDNQGSSYEYNLLGLRLKEIQDVSSNREVSTAYFYTVGGALTSQIEDSGVGGLGALSTKTPGDRFLDILNPDGYGTRIQEGYGSYGMPWKKYNLDNSGAGSILVLTKTYERDSMGRVTRIQSLGNGVRYEYDDFGRLTDTIEERPLLGERYTTNALNFWGEIESTQVTVGGAVHFDAINEYDSADRLVKTVVKDPSGVLGDRVIEYILDANGRVAELVDSQGGSWITSWFEDGRVKSNENPAGDGFHFSYDDLNRTTTKISREKNTLTLSTSDFSDTTKMNASGWVIERKEEGSALGSRLVSFEYDFAGHRIKVTDPEGLSTNSTIDGLGRVEESSVQIDSQTSAITSYEYSLGGLKEKILDANSKQTVFSYDSFRRKLSESLTVSGGQLDVYSWDYGIDGRLDTHTDPMGTVKTYTYDGGGRLVQLDIDKTASGLMGPDRVVYQYDNLDRATNGTTQTSQGAVFIDEIPVTFEYDGFGQLVEETQYGSHAIKYEYGVGGLVEKVIYPSGSPIESVKYQTDEVGRVKSVTRALAGTNEVVIGNFEYEGNREISRVYPQHDLVRTQSWTSFREPEELRIVKSSTSNLITGLKNSWNSSRLISTRERLHDADSYSWGEVYRYDGIGRLTQMWDNVRNPQIYSVSDPVVNYGNEVVWNLGAMCERVNVTSTPAGGVAEVESYTTNEGYQYSDVSTLAGNISWNGNGGMAQWDETDLFWTALGQIGLASTDPLTSVDDVSFAYDAFGRRVKRIAGGAERQMLYHGGHMIGVFDTSISAWLWQEVPMPFGEGMLEHVALDSNDLDGDLDLNEHLSYAVHEDWQHSVWGLSDLAGNLTERYTQVNPFGISSTVDSSGFDIGLFSSKVFHYKRMHGGVVEQGLGLYDFRNRWYNPSTGSWLSRDPLWQIDSENLYQSFLANPLVSSDVWGLQVENASGANEAKWDAWETIVTTGTLSKGWGKFPTVLGGRIYKVARARSRAKSRARTGSKKAPAEETGYRNKLRHCNYSCELYSDLPDFAEDLLDIHEARGLGQSEENNPGGVPGEAHPDDIEDYLIDIVSNADGKQCAGSPAGCECCCLETYGLECEDDDFDAQRLEPEYEKVMPNEIGPFIKD